VKFSEDRRSTSPQRGEVDNPSPSQWTIPRCQKWLDLYPISDYSDTVFLCSENQVRLDIVAKAVEQKKSEEQSFVPVTSAIIGMVMIQFFV
jgi:hypothetical protein